MEHYRFEGVFFVFVFGQLPLACLLLKKFPPPQISLLLEKDKSRSVRSEVCQIIRSGVSVLAVASSCR